MDEAKSDIVDAKNFLWEGENYNQLILYSAIGRIVVIWGMLEYHVTSNIMLCLHNLDAYKLVKQSPNSFKDKMDLWKKIFRNTAGLEKYSDAACAWADDALEASKDRNIIMHHNWGTILDTDGDLVVNGGAIRGTKTGHQFSRSELSLENLYNCTVEMDSLNTRLLAFTFAIARLQPPLRFPSQEADSPPITDV